MSYNIGVVGLNHKTAALETRESLGFGPSACEDALKKLKRLRPLSEFVILSTCNRAEIYIGSGKEEIRLYDIIDFLSSYHNVAKDDIIPAVYIYRGKEAILHLFEVAAGLDSLVIGEAQVLGQLKNSYHKALDLGSTGKVLNITFQRALKVGKKVRTLTKIGKGNVSISSISCQLALDVLKGLSGKHVLLIGTGKIGRLTLKSLRDRGADAILVSSRNYAKAELLAREFGGKAVMFEKLEDFMTNADLVISSTSAPHYVLHAGMLRRVMKKRNCKPIFLIDLAVPRDIDPLAAGIGGARLYNIDSLKRTADENLRVRKSEIFRCREIIYKDLKFFTEKINCGQLMLEAMDKR